MSATDVNALRALALALLPHFRELGFVPATAADETLDRIPGGESREAWAGKCRALKIDPKYKTAQGWRVPASVYHAAVAAEREAKRKVPQPAAPDSIDLMLQKSGLRLVRRDGGSR